MRGAGIRWASGSAPRSGVLDRAERETGWECRSVVQSVRLDRLAADADRLRRLAAASEVA